MTRTTTYNSNFDAMLRKYREVSEEKQEELKKRETRKLKLGKKKRG